MALVGCVSATRLCSLRSLGPSRTQWRPLLLWWRSVRTSSKRRGSRRSNVSPVSLMRYMVLSASVRCLCTENRDALIAEICYPQSGFLVFSVVSKTITREEDWHLIVLESGGQELAKELWTTTQGIVSITVNHLATQASMYAAHEMPLATYEKESSRMYTACAHMTLFRSMVP